jgi:4-amino-4-deoxy-L-arabinose transferase-like glycosyltransferase
LAVLLSVTTILKKRNLLFSMLIGVVTGLAFLSKWSPALVVFPVWILGEWMANGKTRIQLLQHLLAAVLAFFLITAPWLLYVFKEFPDEAAWIFRKFTHAYNETVEQHTGPFYHYFQNMGMVFGEIIWIPLIISFYQLLKRQADWKIAALNAWCLIPFVIFSFAATKRHTYLLLAAPAIFVLLSYYWFYISESNLINKWVKHLLLFLLIALPVRYCIERTKPFINVERSPAWATELKQMKNKFDNNTVFFNYEHAIEGMYYTDYTFYTRLPRPDEIAVLQIKGYHIVVKEGDTENE